MKLKRFIILLVYIAVIGIIYLFIDMSTFKLFLNKNITEITVGDLLSSIVVIFSAFSLLYKK